MPEPRQLSAKVAVGGQPTVDDLRELKAQGFVAVVNLRTVGEAGQPLSPEAEGFAAQEAGLDLQPPAGRDPGDRPRPCPPPARCDRAHKARSTFIAAPASVPARWACWQPLGREFHGDDRIARAEAAGLPVTDPAPRRAFGASADPAPWVGLPGGDVTSTRPEWSASPRRSSGSTRRRSSPRFRTACHPAIGPSTFLTAVARSTATSGWRLRFPDVSFAATPSLHPTFAALHHRGSCGQW